MYTFTLRIIFTGLIAIVPVSDGGQVQSWDDPPWDNLHILLVKSDGTAQAGDGMTIPRHYPVLRYDPWHLRGDCKILKNFKCRKPQSWIQTGQRGERDGEKPWKIDYRERDEIRHIDGRDLMLGPIAAHPGSSQSTTIGAGQKDVVGACHSQTFSPENPPLPCGDQSSTRVPSYASESTYDYRWLVSADELLEPSNLDPTCVEPTLEDCHQKIAARLIIPAGYLRVTRLSPNSTSPVLWDFRVLGGGSQAPVARRVVAGSFEILIEIPRKVLTLTSCPLGEMDFGEASCVGSPPEIAEFWPGNKRELTLLIENVPMEELVEVPPGLHAESPQPMRHFTLLYGLLRYINPQHQPVPVPPLGGGGSWHNPPRCEPPMAIGTQ